MGGLVTNPLTPLRGQVKEDAAALKELNIEDSRFGHGPAPWHALATIIAEAGLEHFGLTQAKITQAQAEVSLATNPLTPRVHARHRLPRRQPRRLARLCTPVRRLTRTPGSPSCRPMGPDAAPQAARV